MTQFKWHLLKDGAFWCGWLGKDFSDIYENKASKIPANYWSAYMVSHTTKIDKDNLLPQRSNCVVKGGQREKEISWSDDTVIFSFSETEDKNLRSVTKSAEKK